MEIKIIEMNFCVPISDEIDSHLTQLATASQAEAGCLQYEVYRHISKDKTILFVESWQSPDNLEQHRMGQAVAHFKQKLGHLIASKAEIGQ